MDREGNMIKILVSCHKKSYVPKSKYLFPIQVGCALSDSKYQGMYYDNEGEHISGKNKLYCELTAQYWAWKNLDADYYGFFHYRRYLSFQKEYPVMENGKLSVKRWRPYTEMEHIKDYTIVEEKLKEVVEKYDIVTVLREPMNTTVYQQYCQFHKKKDLDQILELINQKQPLYKEAAKEYMASKEHYFLNMYVMKKELFFEYMEWLFPLLGEFEEKAEMSDYNEQEYRAPAYLAERLFGIYITYLKKTKKKKLCELPYVIFHKTEPLPQVLPIFPKDSIHMVMASDNRFCPYLAVLLQSIVECASTERWYDIVVFHCQIQEENQDRIQKIAEGRERISIRFCNISEYVEGISFVVHHHFSVETFYRYFIPEVMKEYQKILYLDVDMVVLRDIAELFQEDMEGYALAAVKDVDVIGSAKADKGTEQYLTQELYLKNAFSYFQAGVLLLNLEEIRSCCKVSDLVEKTLEKKWRMLDQDVLNTMFKNKVKYLPQNWNVLINWKYGNRSRMDLIKQAPVSLWEEYQEARKQPYIIHYAGAWKPWSDPCCDYAEIFWEYARKTAFYEGILYEHASSKKWKHIFEENNQKRIIRLRPTRLEIAIDMKKINHWMPAGSIRRQVVRKLVEKFL